MLKEVKELISRGADKNHIAGEASCYGHLETLKYLVGIGADIRVNDDYALRWAGYNGHLEVVEYIESL